MGEVVKMFDTAVPGTGLELIQNASHSNATGTIMFVLCLESGSGMTAGFVGVADPNKNDFQNGINIAKFGSKLSKRDADYHFGTQDRYKYV